MDKVAISALRKALPYAATVIGAGAAGGALGATVAGKKKFRQGKREGITAAVAHMRRRDMVRNRALRAYVVRSHLLSQQNRSLRARLAESMSSRRMQG